MATHSNILAWKIPMDGGACGLQSMGWDMTDRLSTAHTVSFLVVRACCCSVAQSCPTLCEPMDCSMLGFPVHHHLLEFAQTHVHRVSDATQPSHWKLVEWNDCNPVGLSASFGTHLLIKYIQTSKMLLRTEGQWSELRGRDHGCGSWCGRRKTAQPLPGSLPLEHLSPISLHSFQPSWGLFPFCLLLISCIGPCWGRLAVL